MSSKNFYGLTGDVTVDGGILNVGNAQLYANTETSNVGIGTSNPEFELDVHGNANVGVLYSTFLHGDGSNIQNIVSSQWEGSPGDPIYYASNVGIANTSPVTATLQIGSNVVVDDVGSNVIHVTGNIYADYLVGDGSQLTGIAASLDQIVDQGNTVSNTIQLVSGQDATSNIGLVTWEGVGISVSNANPTGEYQFGVGSNLLVNVYSSNVMTVDGNVFAQKMTLGTVTITPAYNLQQITETGATSNQTLVLSNVTTGLTADANIVVDGNVTAGSVITSGNVNAGNVITSTNINVGGDLSVTGNVYVDDMRVAEVASNLVTYDSTTGELLDSGGLFSNKLAVVSEQPPIALTGASTAVTSHGTYTIEASSGTVTELFDKNVSTVWTTSVSYNTLDGSYNTGSSSLAGVSGEWAKITMPYKTILRHVKIESTNSSIKDVTLVGLNADGLTWTSLKTVDGLNEETSTIIVNAATHHRTYGLIVRATNVGSTQAEIGDLKLFTESFSIDGGKVAMASSAVMGGETTVDQSGPHSRLPKAMPLKKFPEIVFESGKFDGSRTSTDATYDEQYYLQAGTTVKVVSETTSRVAHQAFNGDIVGANGNGWHTQFGFDRNTGLYDTSNNRGDTFTDTNGDPHLGMWIQTKFPNKIKVKNINLYIGNNLYRYPKSLVVLGHSSLSSLTGWTLLHTETDISTTTPALGDTTPTVLNVNADTAFDCYTILVKSARPEGVAGQQSIWVSEIEYYGYEELATQGDTSVDTTFTSIMNTPQTTGANVYIDGNLGETFTNRVTGPDATGTATSYNETGKYWELTGALTSNVSLEANTFLEGDQPHAVSVWFNSSNLEANTANTCVFSISDQEKLDSVNLDLQSNTWHNLTYAYQGEGGSRVTYLDGRKVAEDQAEDTFGEYPPFAMTGYSQGGYVLSVDADHDGTNKIWKAFDGDDSSSSVWFSQPGSGDADSSYQAGYARGNPGQSVTDTNGTTHSGSWGKIEFPYKFVLNYVRVHGGTPISSYWPHNPDNYVILGSNDDTNWDLLTTRTGANDGNSGMTAGGTNIDQHPVNATKAYKYIKFLVTKLGSTSGDREFIIASLKLYGHRENDLVRLPDPTNVLKYPHIPLTNYPDRGGPGRRGYVATTSGAPNPAYAAQHAFNGVTVSGEGSWHSYAYYQTDGDRLATRTPTSSLSSWTANGGSTTGELTTHTGEWVKIQLPHKIVLSSIILKQRTGVPLQKVRLFSIVGSNDDTNWFLVHQELTRSGTSTSLQEPDPNTMTGSYSNTAFKYFAIVIHAGVTDNTYDHVAIGEWELYGTGVDSIPIQIGGGNIDKVANFRVYDKFVGEDQALEIWDAQKDAFGRAKSSMTLQKGRLGIGTTEPEGRLAVVDEPHAPEVFPPGNMVADETYFEGHGKFKARGIVINNNVDYPPWEGFNDISEPQTLYYTGSSGGATGDGGFNNSDATYSGTLQLSSETVLGPWLILELPYKVYVSKIEYYPQLSGAGGENLTHQVAEATIYGRNGNGIWKEIATMSTAPIIPNYLHHTFNTLDSSIAYNQLAFIATKRAGQSSAGITVRNLKFFGTREQGQSVLHDGQLTLTKNLNVPRIGPALDADDTPRRDRLLVEYNTSTNPIFEGAVRDTSGRGNDGVFYGGASYDATEKALKFIASSNQYVNTNIPLPADGNFIHSMSMWFNPASLSASTGDSIVFIGDNTDNNKIEIFMETDRINYLFGGNNYEATLSLTNGRWYHLAVTYNGTVGASGREIYIDGVQRSASHSGLSELLNLTNGNLDLGRYTPSGSSSAYAFDGSISNFKLYDTALTAEEVKTLYDMGRCDEGHHVVNFSKTRVGIGLGDGEAPRADLDVRGEIHATKSLNPVAGMWKVTVDSSTVTTTIIKDIGSCMSTRAADGYGGYGGFTGSVGIFVAPYDGVYQFQCFLTGQSTSSNLLLVFNANGPSVTNGTWSSRNLIGEYGEIIDLRSVTNIEETHNFATLLDMSKGDYVDVQTHSTGYLGAGHVRCSCFLAHRY